MSDITVVEPAIYPATATTTMLATPPGTRRRALRLPTQWLGVAPFFLFAIMFLILPTAYLMVGAFQIAEGAFTLENIAALSQPSIVAAYWISIKVSFWPRPSSAPSSGSPSPSPSCAAACPTGSARRRMTFSGVASNFAGVPLAFAFLATLGRLGLVTVLLRPIGIDLYRLGFNILSFWGLTLTYLYFQIPLMVVIITPAIDGLKKEWGEAAATLGATSGNTGAWSSSRCCGRASSAPSSCSSPTPSAPSPPPMH